MAQVTKVQVSPGEGTIRVGMSHPGSAGVLPALVHPKKCRQDAGATKSCCPLHCRWFDLQAASAGTKPNLDRHRVDRETNPECGKQSVNATLGSAGVPPALDSRNETGREVQTPPNSETLKP
jgi:hypothetical protein